MNKKFIILFLTIISIIFCDTKVIYAVNTVPTEEKKQEAEERKLMRVESNEWNNWPQGPILGCESAILVDVDTGTILYEKNIHEELYPASTTKIMTALLTIENTSMDEIVTFSHDAIFNVDSDSSRIGIDVGEQLTVEQCLYGLLLGSANEVAYALAEHIGGSLSGFVDMMNSRAKSLGCENTHFINANGLPDKDHYTSAYDLSLIARECFKNEAFANISGTRSYTIPATNIQSQERPLDNHHLMIHGFRYEYDGFVGGKTGYTTEARQTLVSCAERNGVRLICIIMKEESPDQFLDTQKLFDYGFESFDRFNIKENETRYTMNSSTFFNTNIDIMGSSKPTLTLNENGYVILPKNAVFEDATVQINYSEDSGSSVATLDYYYSDNHVGSTTLDYALDSESTFEFANIVRNSDKSEIPKSLKKDKKVVFINIKLIIIIISIILVAILLFIFWKSIYNRYTHSLHRRRKLKIKNLKNRKNNNDF